MWAYDEIVHIGANVAIIVVGGIWALPYFLKLPMSVPGRYMEPGEKPFMRFFVMVVGLALMGNGIWRLIS